MKHLRFFAGLALTCSLCALPASIQAAQLLRYDFEGVAGTNVPNIAPGAAVNGTIGLDGETSILTNQVVNIGGTNYLLGKALKLTPAGGDGATDFGAPHVNTGLTPVALNITSTTNYTAMCWVRFDSETGDNMIFGQGAGGGRLHLGARNRFLHSGHWGDDVTAGLTSATEWRHVAYVNSGQEQFIYDNGVLIANGSAAGVAGMSLTDNVIIGSSGNGGSLAGSVDEVRVFNTAMTAAEIKTEMTAGLPAYTLAALQSASLTKTALTIEIKDSGTSQVQTAGVTLEFDGVPELPADFTVSKTAGVTTITRTFVSAIASGTTHTWKAGFTDQVPTPITLDGKVMATNLLVFYDFEGAAGTDVPNLAPGATINGTLALPAEASYPNGQTVTVGAATRRLGKVLQFNPAGGDGAGDFGAPHVNTGISADELGMVPLKNYTAMAWVKFGSQSGDNMVFGQGAGDRLHNGSRANQYHSGHWGDDLTTGTTVLNQWKHVAWVNSSQTQAMYVDGQIIGSGAEGAGSMSTIENVLIGSSGGGGSLVGVVDNVKIYDGVLSQTQIATQMLNGLPVYDLGTLQSAILSTTALTIVVKDSAASTVQTSPVTLLYDGAAVAPTSVTRVADTVVIVYNTSPVQSSSHTFAITVLDQLARGMLFDGTLIAPYFPVSLPGPAGTVGRWGMRELRQGAGIGDPGLVKAIAIAKDATAPLVDATDVPVVNHSDPESRGGRGNFNNDLNFIGDQVGTDDNDVVLVAKTQVSIPAAGTYTFGAHSDDGFGLLVTGGRFISSNGNGAIDASDPRALVHVAYTGDSNTRGVYQFDAAGTYDVTFVAFEGGGGAFWELYWAQGAFNEDKDTGSWQLLGTPSDPAVTAIPFSPRWLTPLPGPSGAASRFGVRTYIQAAAVDNLQQTMDFLSTTVRNPVDSPLDTIDTQEVYLNHRDPFTNGDAGVFGADFIVPADTLTGNIDDDRVVTTAHAKFVITAEDDYTFNVHGDDGFLLRIIGPGGVKPAFKRVTGLGRFEMSNPNEMFFENGTGDTSTRGIVHLTPGVYEFEYVNWEGAGGYWYEVTVARGAFPDDGSPGAVWRPLGYQGPDSGFYERPGIADPGWTVESSPPGSLLTFDIAGAEASIDADKITTTHPVINFNDPGFGGPGSIGGDVPWPRDVAGADDDNYAMRMKCTMVIAAEGDYDIGFQGDDGGYLIIEGQTWLSLVQNLTGASVIEASTLGGPNDKIRCEIGTGNSRTVGRIHLMPGSYTVRSLVYEGGGGSYYEIFGAKGPAGFNFQLPLLEQGPTGRTTADPAGVRLLAVLPEPPVVIDVSKNGQIITLTWTSEAAAAYDVDASIDLTTGSWSTLVENIPSGGATTTQAVNLAPTAFAGQPRVYFRARKR